VNGTHRRAMLALGLAVGLAASCIKRDPAVHPPAPRNGGDVAGGAVATRSTSTDASAPLQATGMWGKVAGIDLLNGQSTNRFVLSGQKERVRLTKVPVSQMPFGEAYRVQVLSTPPNTYDVQLAATSTVPVERGDILLATVYFRTHSTPEESGEGQSEFVFELSRNPYTKSVTYPLRAGQEWKQVNVAFVAAQRFAPGEAQMMIRLGYGSQITEFGGISIRNFGKQLALADLPVTRVSYRGIEPDAPWRKAAADRIEQNRKAPLTVVVRDAAGKPVRGANVQVTLKQHAFGFGSCLPAARITSTAADDERLKALTLDLFNVATLENDLKWVPLAGDWGRSFTIGRAVQAIDWLKSNGLSVRGHVLVWPGWRNLPRSLKTLEKAPSQLKAEIDKHIRETAAATQGKLLHWDVVNEPFDNHDLMDLLGSDVMLDWFQAAHETDPQAQLFINDYAILSGGGGTTAHRDHYENTIRSLLEKGARLDGIGMQGHFGTSLTAPDDLIRLLDRYAKFHRPIWVTEYDVVLGDEEMAGSYTRDFYTALFSHPAVGGIVMWGFWDGAHWKSNAPLFHRDWSPKPAGESYRELVKKTWHTEATLRTDGGGAILVRGFLGTYAIDVTVGAKQQTATGTLTSGGSTIVVTMAP
jgi:endo-1,4-beta-xylanase